MEPVLNEFVGRVERALVNEERMVLMYGDRNDHIYINIIPETVVVENGNVAITGNRNEDIKFSIKEIVKSLDNPYESGWTIKTSESEVMITFFED